MWYQITFGIVALIAFCMWFLPIYNVWKSRKSGQADLAEAEFAEQVAIAEANARKSAAIANKEAELIEASAIAESIRLIGDSLEKNTNYLKWQWIKAMAETENELVYVPTEAGLPILEAGKRNSL